MKASYVFVLLGLIAAATAEIYFQDSFHDLSKWVQSNNKDADGTNGKLELNHGKYHGDKNEDQGAKTSQDAHFYQYSAVFPEFSNKGKKLVIQYSVKHEQNIDCVGAYLKIGPKGIDQSNFNGDTQYNIMFGPDICGMTKKTHLIFNYKGTNHLIKSDIRTESDTNTHLYTLVLNSDNTYEVLIDGKSASKGNMKDDFDMLPSKEIKDPKAKKPSDWVDDKTIPDPEDHKPAGWDDIPSQVADPDAKKPDDWDDELDGEWEAPMIDNPDYEGEWKAKQIPNPAYKGEWVHPLIPNPDYLDDNELYAYPSTGYVGIEIWQVKAGTIFDNIIITDSMEAADKLGALTTKLQEAEKKEAEEARKQEDEERAKAAAAADEDEEDIKDEL